MPPVVRFTGLTSGWRYALSDFLYYPMLLHGNNKEKFNKEYN